mgnify:FL=1
MLVRTYLGAMGRTSFDTYHEMLRTDEPDTVYANGGATIVWVDFPKQKSVAMSAHARALIESAGGLPRLPG